MSQQRDNLIAALAAPQHGVVTRAQLVEAGISTSAIDRRASRGSLKRLHPGVYHVGPVESPHTRALAAVLACGAGAVLSHGSAGGAWGLLAAQARAVAIDVAVPERVRVRFRGITVHRTRDLGANESALLNGVPITTPARTLFDLASVLGTHELERAVALAERLGVCDAKALLELVAARPRHPGGTGLRQLLTRTHPPALTRSEAESRLLDLVRRARLPAPRTNTALHGFEVDFLWTGPKLVVEVDGFAYHGTAAAFARDRRRDAALIAAGYRVMRFIWADLQEQPEATLVMLAQALVR